ncbi:hypothetical protein ABOM_010715 [Aspergillus bombycis]|uniref:Uncharacterized protein n=1 Tax=Aspergillus bombycis TaxID=109264 RepID=A0A1F7ZMH4_9EURO|nr:hypothetical protein ABOM_010715 [Aspergillus bombycis]OGM40622.1 hypothetical protein ABOM_010715 [Aspergillus bombycis]
MHLLLIDAAQRLGNAGYGLKYVAHWGQLQGTGWSFDGGAVLFLVMVLFPDVDEIRDELLMRKNGYKLYEQHPSFLRYDKVADKLYLVDLTFIGFTDPNSETSIPVREDNVYGEAFNIWLYPYEEPPQLPRSTQLSHRAALRKMPLQIYIHHGSLSKLVAASYLTDRPGTEVPLRRNVRRGTMVADVNASWLNFCEA